MSSRYTDLTRLDFLGIHCKPAVVSRLTSGLGLGLKGIGSSTIFTKVRGKWKPYGFRGENPKFAHVSLRCCKRGKVEIPSDSWIKGAELRERPGLQLLSGRLVSQRWSSKP